MKKEHYYYIDVLKGIGIILVVLGHLNPYIRIEKWIYSFHMFLFFFLSGFVFKKKESLWIQVKTSAKTLLLPYIFWNGVAILVSLIIGEYTLLTGVKRLFFWDWVSWNSPVWFLVVLFWTRAFYQLLSDKKWIIISAMCFMAVACYCGIFNKLPFGLFILPNAVIFFGIGKLVSQIEIKKWYYALAIPMLLVSIVGSQINGRISMYGNHLGLYQIALVVGICGVLGMFLIAKFFAKPGKVTTALSKIGGYSMNVMCTHYFILRIMQSLSVRFANGYDLWKDQGLLKAIIVTIVVFVLEFLFVKLLKTLKITNSHIMRV